MLMSVTKLRLDEAIQGDMALRKLKMKIERLLINNNEQSEEALKHIYTALLANPDIEIQIDLPDERLLFTNDTNSEEFEEDPDDEEEV